MECKLASLLFLMKHFHTHDLDAPPVTISCDPPGKGSHVTKTEKAGRQEEEASSQNPMFFFVAFLLSTTVL